MGKRAASNGTQSLDDFVLSKGRRYRAKMRSTAGIDIIFTDIGDQAEFVMGTWDCLQKRFVQRSKKTGEWVGEKWDAETQKWVPDE
jgi:hypothetical protein